MILTKILFVVQAVLQMFPFDFPIAFHPPARIPLIKVDVIVVQVVVAGREECAVRPHDLADARGVVTVRVPGFEGTTASSDPHVVISIIWCKDDF